MIAGRRSERVVQTIPGYGDGGDVGISDGASPRDFGHGAGGDDGSGACEVIEVESIAQDRVSSVGLQIRDCEGGECQAHDTRRRDIEI